MAIEIVRKLEFDQKTHVFRYDGKVVPSVTQVLKGTGLIDHAFFSEYARERGQFAHEAIALHIHEELDEATLDPVLRPYLDGYIKFKKDTGFKPVLIEAPLYSETYRFAGIVDAAGDFKDGLAVVDWKTGQPHPSHAIQLAGYRILIDKPSRRFGVYLDGAGGYKMVEYSNRKDDGIFYAALALWNWKNGTQGGSNNGNSDSRTA